MLRATAAGLAVFAAAYALCYFVFPVPFVGDFVPPALAGFAASWIAPRRRILIGMATALPPTAFYAAEQAVCELTGGRCDQVGATGAVFLTAFTLMWNLGGCGGGAVVAAVVRSRLAADAR